jgi:hypothetical protein
LYHVTNVLIGRQRRNINSLPIIALLFISCPMYIIHPRHLYITT